MEAERTSLRVIREFGETMGSEDLAAANVVEETTYHRTFNEVERVTINESLAGLSVKEDTLSDEAKATAKHYREELKALRDDKKTYVRALRSGRMAVKGEVFVFLDPENGKVHKYDDQGNRIETRRMNAEEAQLSIQ